MRYLIIILFMVSFILAGCSGGGQSVSQDPVLPNPRVSDSASHYTWGLWQWVVDPGAKRLDIIQLRTGSFHLNALPFLEPPPLANLTLESLQFNGNLIDADIGLRHPFLGLTEFTGFDVCGIFISNGSVSGFSDPGIVMAGEGDTRLLNYDGLSRWWNPTEFPINEGTIFSYNDGLLGTADAVGNYNSTLNGYKYFCDDLDADASMDNVTLERRGLFSAGKKNIRHYALELGDDGLVFNYAVDACWQFPNGGAPWQAPDDFAPEANRPEAWRINVTEIENTLFNDGSANGGDLKLQVDVYDWFNADMDTVRVESPGNFPFAESSGPIGGGDGYSTYEIDISDATPDAGNIDLLISVVSEDADFGGFLPGINTTAYFTHSVEVSGETPAQYHWEFDDVLYFAAIPRSSYPDAPEFDDISPAICEETDHDIGLTWGITDTNEIDPDDDSAFCARYSTDNGVTYANERWPNTAGEGITRIDRAKIAPDRLGYSIATSSFGPPFGDIFVSRIEYPPGGNGVYVSVPARDNEVIVDPDGWIYCFDDSGINIKEKHSQGPDTLDPWVWSQPPYVAFPVATGAYNSHVRSADVDSSAVVWLAFYNSAEKSIKLAHSTDSSPHETWDDSTVVYTGGSGIDLVKNPSLAIDSLDVFHLCYTRLNSDGNYELVYTSDDSAFDNPSEDILFVSPDPINDAHIAVGEKFGKQVITFTYENNKSIYLLTLVDGILISTPEEIDVTSDDIQPDGILDSDQCDFHSVWSTRDGNNYDLARRNGILVED